MKVNQSWLKEWVNPELEIKELVEQVTMAGLEVDALTPVAGTFDGVVVGEIIACEQHPDADKLKVCRVAGAPDGEKQVVCGAPNARPGLKVPFALVGAKLPGDFKIKKAKLRGVESFGMLCAQTELEAGEDDSGLWELPVDAPVGTALREYLQLDDVIIEFDLTPNRSDCLSVRGLAREIATLNRCALNAPEILPIEAVHQDTRGVCLDAGDACPRYVGRVIREVDPSRSSPLWLQERLRRCGMRSIDAIVDITNYVMLELGQPMHAFDNAALDGDVRVRWANKNEPLTLLDGQTVELSDDTLVIADEKRVLAIAGVMGGEGSGVNTSTVDIFLESAFFAPEAVAGRARRYGLHTESSHRFERGVDYACAAQAIERATRLVLDIAGGKPGPVVVTDNDGIPNKRSIVLRENRVESGLGISMARDEIQDILQRLGFALKSPLQQAIEVEAPTFRFDIAIEEDLLEELARIYGYNRLPIASVPISKTLPPAPEGRVLGQSLEDHLISRDYQEAITYSFQAPELHAMFHEGQAAISLKNPISADLSVMRTSLLPGLVGALAHNVKRQKSRVRLFERGLRFRPTEHGLQQTPSLAGLVYGARDSVSWHDHKTPVDFFDIKGDLEGLLEKVGGEVEFRAASRQGLHPGQTAEIVIDGQSVGYVGALHPSVSQSLELSLPAFVFECSLEALTRGRVPAFSPISRFPEIDRDLAVIVPREIPVRNLEISITRAAGPHLKNLKAFDVYSGEGIDPQRKSVAFNLTFQDPSRTLKEDEINAPMASIVKQLEEEFNARLR